METLIGKQIISACGGQDHTLILTTEGIYSCGSASGGALGTGSVQSTQPKLITGLLHKKVVQIASGYGGTHAFALTGIWELVTKKKMIMNYMHGDTMREESLDLAIVKQYMYQKKWHCRLLPKKSLQVVSKTRYTQFAWQVHTSSNSNIIDDGLVYGWGWNKK